MKGFDPPDNRPAGNRKPIRPWDVAGSEQGEEKLVEFPSPARPTENELPPAPDDLDGKVEQQLRRLRSARGELEETIRKQTEELRRAEARRAELAADLTDMRVTLSNVDSQIRELEVLEELIRGLQQDT